MKIRPLYDRVVVRRKEEEEKTAGGILLPGSAKEKPNKAKSLRSVMAKFSIAERHALARSKSVTPLYLDSMPEATPSTLTVKNSSL